MDEELFQKAHAFAEAHQGALGEVLGSGLESDWPRAQAVLAELEELHIYMLDPSPSNIRFR
jgi:hypothetical protein